MKTIYLLKAHINAFANNKSVELDKVIPFSELEQAQQGMSSLRYDIDENYVSNGILTILDWLPRSARLMWGRGHAEMEISEVELNETGIGIKWEDDK